MMDSMDTFQVGKRNSLATRKILWKAGVMAHGEEIGGRCARTVSLEVGSGRVRLKALELPAGRELQ